LRVVLIVACALAVAGPSTAGIVVTHSIPTGGARGLLVPGHGVTVTRAGALDALRGQTGPSGTTVYVTLPPPGRSHNVRRYPVTVVGAGFHGLLTSSATRVPGLVSIEDLDRLGWKDDANPARTLRSLDARLAAAHDVRNWATVTLMLITLALAGAALLARSRRLAHAAVLAIPAGLGAALVLSALDSTSVPAFALLVVGGAFAGTALPLRPLLLVFLLGYLVALAAWPDVNALAILGPHPDGGGRFYGVTNEVETLLLAPALAAGPVGLAIGLLLVGWSKAGADGGGLVVFAVALLVALRGRVTPRLLVGALGIALALVGLDAALGGSSHVTRTVFHPIRLAYTLGHRWRVSWDGITATGHSALIAGLTLAGVLLFVFLRPRLTPLLAALAVSLLVNDTAADVIGFGALSCAAVWPFYRLAPRCADSPSPEPSSRSLQQVAGAREWWRRRPRPS
jgi:hypothetical protein